MPRLTLAPESKSTPLCCARGKLAHEVDYVHYAPEDREGLKRPLSPVRLRAVRPEDTPPKILPVKEKNEARARGSPFVSHMPRAKKEQYLYIIGSVREPQDEDLLLEMALTSKLSKIASPIKPDQNSRNLHLPRKVPTSETYADSFHESCHRKTHEIPQIRIPRAGVRVGAGVAKHGPGVGPGPGGRSPQAHAEVLVLDSKDDPYLDAGMHNGIWPHSSPYAPMPQTLAANACATPGSCISDLSDRDTTTPLYTDRDSLPTRTSGGGGSGVYGDMEDDLVSGGSVNEDEYIL